MDDRYEIKVYTGRDKHRSYSGKTVYGVWDKKNKKWVLNTEGVAESVALRFLLALRKDKK